jgi:murein DD-endopeptidase MepM/ murein hydrolase activator NlpD
MYTVRYAHLKEQSPLEVGDFVNRGDLIGIMGSTGQSTGPHLHIDVVEGKVSKMFRLSDIGTTYAPNFRQLALFIDEELGNGPFRVTTWPYDARYIINGQWKAHPGYDIVVQDKIFWNRSMTGKVIRKGHDNGYGHHVYIAFRA